MHPLASAREGRYGVRYGEANKRRIRTPAAFLGHKRATRRVDVTVMTRTRVYEKYRNAEWRNKKLALYQILLSSSAAADRRSCTVARSAGRCAVINRDSMQTTSKVCKAEFFPDESSLPWDIAGRRFTLLPHPSPYSFLSLSKHASASASDRPASAHAESVFLFTTLISMRERVA